jgi:hypothetical protein
MSLNRLNLHATWKAVPWNNKEAMTWAWFDQEWSLAAVEEDELVLNSPYT